MEKLRLERENDSLAYEVVTTQVSMQEIITDVNMPFYEMCPWSFLEICYLSLL